MSNSLKCIQNTVSTFTASFESIANQISANLSSEFATLFRSSENQNGKKFQSVTKLLDAVKTMNSQFGRLILI